MQYSIFTDDISNTFDRMYSTPYWQYPVLPRVPEDAVYAVTLDFNEYPLNMLGGYFVLQSGDMLEVFLLKKRVLLIAAQIEVLNSADVTIIPKLRSGLSFDPVDCRRPSRGTYLLEGGMLDRTTEISKVSLLIEEPDYFGLELYGDMEDLAELRLRITLDVSDTFAYNNRSNSSK